MYKIIKYPNNISPRIKIRDKHTCMYTCRFNINPCSKTAGRVYDEVVQKQYEEDLSQAVQELNNIRLQLRNLHVCIL